MVISLMGQVGNASHVDGQVTCHVMQNRTPGGKTWEKTTLNATSKIASSVKISNQDEFCLRLDPSTCPRCWNCLLYGSSAKGRALCECPMDEMMRAIRSMAEELAFSSGVINYATGEVKFTFPWNASLPLIR